MAGPGAYCFGEEERKEVLDVLETGHLSRYGHMDDPAFKHKVFSFEKEFAKHLGTPYALATSSGTTALLVALLAAGVKPGDEVLVPGYTYVASISAIIYAQANPVLVEIDNSLNMDPQGVKRKISQKTKAILVVHMLGNPCDMESIMNIANEHKLLVIEDACQAIGASFKGRKVGTFGDVGTFSLNRYKMIAGEGGVVTTNDKQIYERAFAIHDQGHRPNRSNKDAAGTLIGLNLKMNEMTGAVALAQTRKLNWMLETLHRKKAMLKEQLDDIERISFRKINDIQGECATVLTVIFETKEHAEAVAQKLKSKTMINSGWHVYRNMDQIINARMPADDWKNSIRYSQPGELPQTDDILSRSVSLSIGVVDDGLGTGFGINIHSTDAEIKQVAKDFRDAVMTTT